jgi:hypothetical protein
MARRHVDNQSPDLAPPDPLKLMHDRSNMPVGEEGLSRVECHQAASEEQLEVPPQDCVVKRLLVTGHFYSPFSLA